MVSDLGTSSFSHSTYIALETEGPVRREEQNDILGAPEGFGQLLNRGVATCPEVFILARVNVVDRGGLEHEEAGVCTNIGRGLT